MPTTCKLIAKSVLGSDAANIDFTSIPGTYTDLLIVGSVRTANAATREQVWLRFNGATSNTNHSGRDLESNGSSVFSGTANSIYCIVNADTSTASTFGSFEVYIPNYAGSTAKSMSITSLNENNATSAAINLLAGLWNDTSAINAVKVLSASASNLKTGSAIYIYGITKSA